MANCGNRFGISLLRSTRTLTNNWSISNIDSLSIWTNKFTVNRCLFTTSIEMNSNTKYAHARLLDKGKNVHFAFDYEYQLETGSDDSATEQKQVKQFSFKRPADEPTGKFLDRLKLNVNNFLLERLNRKQTKLAKKESKETKSTLIERLSQQIQTLKSNQIEVDLVIDGQTSVDRSITNDRVFAEGQSNRLRLNIGSVSYSILLNQPYVKSFKMPKLIMAEHPVCAQVTVENGDALDCRFRWYHRKPKQKWTLASDQFFYVPTPDHVEDHVKLSVFHESNDGKLSFEVEQEASVRVQTAPPPCPYQERHRLTKRRTTVGQFRCVSYNMLADFYADSEYSRTVLFPYCPPEYLSMNYRQYLLADELLGYNADLICLQETDKSLYTHKLSRLLALKQQMAGDLCLKAGNLSEGLACFYRLDKFHLLQTERHVFTELIEREEFAEIKNVIANNEQLTNRFDLKTVLQLLVLESKESPGQVLLVANTHLYSQPDADHIRLLQASVLIRYVEMMYRQLSTTFDRVAVVLMGDFNSTPECGVYRLMTTGSVDKEAIDWKSNEQEIVADYAPKHSLRFQSACGVPEYTNYTPNFKGCLDYIYADSKRLKVDRVIALIDHEQVIAHKAIPNQFIPSDHLALVCDLSYV